MCATKPPFTPIILLAITAIATLSSCGDSSPAKGEDAMLPPRDMAPVEDIRAAVDTAAPRDTALEAQPDGQPSQDLLADATGPDAKTYRNSLSICWTDATCQRVMAIAHGGAWDLANKPYDSNAAIEEAYALGIEGVKIDVRVTKDNVPVIAHSSPIEIYESLDCFNQKIEEMTAAQVVLCHRFPSATETFQRLDDVLDYLRGKMVTQLCVKESSDYARTVAEIHAKQAEDFAFIEIDKTSELQHLIPTIPGSDRVWYLVNVGSNVSEVDTIIDTIKNPRAFMVEFDPDVEVAEITSKKLHPANVRSFTYTSSITASALELAALFNGGYDVVSAQSGPNVVQARIMVNQARGVSPP